MSGNDYMAQLEWQVENQQRIIRGLESDVDRLKLEIIALEKQKERETI